MMRSKLLLTTVAALGIVAASVMFNTGAQSAQKEDSDADKIEAVKKAIAESKLPEEIKKTAAASKNPTYGKVFSLWPRAGGTYYFAIATPKGAVAFTFQTGDLKADAMIKILMYAYEKRIAIWVFEDPAKPQRAESVVTITP